MTTASNNETTIRRYLAALADGALGERLGAFFTQDTLQIELPNRLNPNGGRSDLTTLLKRAKQGQAMLRQQRYDVLSIVCDGDRVAVEAQWSAELAVPVGTLEAGATMRAHFAMFFEMADGLIRVQRNYDCFEPW